MKLCPYCHSWISENDFQDHVREHVRLEPDGQMRDHVTLRPEKRFAGEWNEFGPIRRRDRRGAWGLWIAILGVGGVVAVMLVGGVILAGVFVFRAPVNRPRQVAPGPLPAGPDARREFPPLDFPRGPDVRDILREQNARLEEARKRQEELRERMRAEPLAPPEPILPLDMGPPNFNSSLEEARQRSEEARQRAQQQLDSMRKRMRASGS